MQLDGEPATLVDVSRSGLQVLCPKALRPNRQVRVSLPRDEGEVLLRASVVWAAYELEGSRGPHFRAGLAFVDADPKTIDALCAQHNGESLGELIPQPLADAVGWLLRAIQTLRAYPADNDISRRAIAELLPRLAEILPLTLEVTADGLQWKGTPFLDASRSAPPIIRDLYRDGIRRISFEQGLDQDEVQGFLLALARPLHPEDVSEDYVTRLWEAELPHVRIAAVDPYLDADISEDVLEGKEEPTREVSDEPASPEPDVPPPPESAFEVEAEDEVRVAEEVQRADASMRWGDFIDSIFDAAATPTGERRSSDLVEMIETNFHRLVSESQLTLAERIVEQLRRLVTSAEVPAYEPLLSRIAQPDRLARLHEVLEAGAGKAQAAVSLLVALAPESIEAVCDFLERSISQRSRRTYIDVLGQIGDGAAERVLERFRQSAPQGRQAYAQVLGRLHGTAVVSCLVRALSERDPAARREIVRALSAQDDRKAGNALSRTALEDVDAGCRVIALRGFAHGRPNVSYRTVLQRIQSREYHELQPDEKDLLFLVLGAIGDDGVVPELRKMLTPGWFPGRQRRDDWPRAASALARLGTHAARATLESLTRRRRRGLAVVCANALREATQEGP